MPIPQLGLHPVIVVHIQFGNFTWYIIYSAEPTYAPCAFSLAQSFKHIDPRKV